MLARHPARVALPPRARAGARSTAGSRRRRRVPLAPVVVVEARLDAYVLYKRLHRATAQPPKAPDPSTRALELDVQGLAALMRGVDRPPRGNTRNRP